MIKLILLYTVSVLILIPCFRYLSAKKKDRRLKDDENRAISEMLNSQHDIDFLDEW